MSRLGLIKEDIVLSSDEAFVLCDSNGTEQVRLIQIVGNGGSAIAYKAIRNKNGSKYVRCGSCCKKKSGKTCYITDYGTCYHVSLECRGLKRTVYVISMDKVGKRHPCKKCT